MLVGIRAQGVAAAWLMVALAALSTGCATTQGKTGARTPWIWPVSAEHLVIASPFGDQRSTHRHKGVDLQVPEGTPVHATADGVVAFSGKQGDYGNIIVVDHANRVSTAYAHLKKRRVDQGDTVQRGQQIGDVGKSGNATTYHLHYEVRVDGQPVDPMGYLPR